MNAFRIGLFGTETKASQAGRRTAGETMIAEAAWSSQQVLDRAESRCGVTKASCWSPFPIADPASRVGSEGADDRRATSPQARVG